MVRYDYYAINNKAISLKMLLNYCFLALFNIIGISIKILP